MLVIAWAVWGASEYRKLKLALAAGRRAALIRKYQLTIAGEILFGVLSLLAVGPRIFHAVPSFGLTLPPGMDGAVWGLLGGLAGSVIAEPLMARWGIRPVQIGDFGALLPQTARERWLFAGVAVSAGVCEELLFRGFGMRLLALAGLAGWSLGAAAALAFGLVHLYQGALGVIGTTLIGLLLALVYVATGSLLLPIILHVLIDLRALALPSGPQAADRRAS